MMTLKGGKKEDPPGTSRSSQQHDGEFYSFLFPAYISALRHKQSGNVNGEEKNKRGWEREKERGKEEGRKEGRKEGPTKI
jgi:flagellar biosynthesis/type III secretory pathway protein FliH